MINQPEYLVEISRNVKKVCRYDFTLLIVALCKTTYYVQIYYLSMNISKFYQSA